MQYVAGSVVGYGMGRLLQRHGWGLWPYAVLPFAILGAALAASLWNTLPKRGAQLSGPAASSPMVEAKGS